LQRDAKLLQFLFDHSGHRSLHGLLRLQCTNLTGDIAFFADRHPSCKRGPAAVTLLHSGPQAGALLRATDKVAYLRRNSGKKEITAGGIRQAGAISEAS
jgi:hypothetical protein